MHYDVTVPLSDRVPVYPGDPAFRLEQVSALARGDVCNLSRMDSGVHAGTHVDAPLHFVAGGAAVHELPLDALLGPAYVVDATALPGHIDAAAVESLDLPTDTERVLFQTTNSKLWASSTFPEQWVGVTPDAAAMLAARGVRLVGVDFLSVSPPGDPTPTHVALLGAGVVVLEGTDLSAVPAGRYDLTCLPLRLVGADGAPARVLLRP